MTSKGPRKGNYEQSTTGTLLSNIPHSKDQGTLRKSGLGNFSSSTTRVQPTNTTHYQALNQHTSANLAAGLSIANATLPFNTSQILGSSTRVPN